MRITALIAICIFVLRTNLLFAQAKDFEFKAPDNSPKEVILKNVDVLDSRADKFNLGYIKKSLGGNFAPVTIYGTLEGEMTSFIKSTYKNETTGLELLVHIRQFSFAEINNGGTQYGYFRVRIDLYSKQHAVFYRIGQLDTIVAIKAMDATSKMFKAANKTFFSWLNTSCTQLKLEPDAWTMDKILSVDQVEKLSIPLYTSRNLPDGIYATWQSLSVLKPDQTELKMEFIEREQELKVEMLNNGEWKTLKLNDKYGYAIALNNTLWILTSKGYRKVFYESGNLYFKAPYSADYEPYIYSPLMMMGLIGALYYTAKYYTKVDYFTFMIDHLNGAPLPVKKGAYEF